MNPMRQCIVNALAELPYEICLPLFDKEIDHLKDIEKLAMENLAYYRIFFPEENNNTAFKMLKLACDERMFMEVAKGIAWARSFVTSQVSNVTKEQKTDADNLQVGKL